MKSGDIIKRQIVFDTLNPCIDNQASIVRMFNTIPELSIDIYVNDTPRILNIRYSELLDYMPTIPGMRNLKVYESQSNNLLLEVPDFEISGGQIFTYAFFGSTSNLILLPIIDNINENIEPDQTKVRFYNLDSNVITFSANPSIGVQSRALSSGQGTDYFPVNPGIYTLRIISSNNRPKVISVSLKPGRIYTIYFFASINPDAPNYNQDNISQVALVVDGNTLFGKCILLR